MNQDYLEKISRLDISEDDKKFWTAQLGNAPPQAWETFFGFAETFPSELDWLASIYTRKQEALQKKDHDLWEEIVREEENWIMAHSQQ